MGRPARHLTEYRMAPLAKGGRSVGPVDFGERDA